MSKGKVLVVDDEGSLRMLLGKELARAGFLVETLADGEDALKAIRHDFYHVVLLDIRLPGMSGMDVLREIKKENIPSEVIILTGNATIENCIECIKIGAFEYVRKPYELSELCIQIDRAIEMQRSRLDVRILQEELRKTGRSGTILGKSRAMDQLRKIIARIAATNSTALILGESGTGKELVARAIHAQSTRCNQPFVTVNCATFTETLLESELFGHEKGAFTDAKAQKLGLADLANNGTLFLDEIGEIPLHFQAKLLRFLERGEIRRVGGTHDITLSVRIICATNQPLEQLVEQKRFRDDLFYRLDVLSVTVPPLKEHGEDIPLLVGHFIATQGFQKEFDREALEIMKNYRWRGNVRELRNVVERTCILSSGKVVTAADLSFLHVSPQAARPVAGDAGRPMSDKKPDGAVPVSLREMERRHILKVLSTVNGQKAKAARILAISPKTLYLKMKAYKIVSVYK
jgi:DNA-binding NtrC family response regulator